MTYASSSQQKFEPLHRDHIAAQLQSWANINTGSDNISGLLGFASMLKHAFATLGGSSTLVPLPERLVIDVHGKAIQTPSGNALQIIKRPEAPIKILLGGHMDTVFPAAGKFQLCEMVGVDKLQGPGVCDMKGGLLVLLKGLELFESSLHRDNVGWEILITPDEEIGSISSRNLWIESARRNHLCLIFEPPFPDGTLVSGRKGSINIAVVVQGKGAHVGREFHKGRNAIVALSEFIIKAHALNDEKHKVTLNIGQMESPGSCGVVPGLAICRLNIRADAEAHITRVLEELRSIATQVGDQSQTHFTLHTLSHRVPKPFEGRTVKLFDAFKDCAQTIGVDIHWQTSGGVCDGNIVSAEGIPTIDTLGAIGGNMHTDEEYVLLDSIPERAQLLGLFLMQLSANQINFKVP
jgi:glutamate carboxypeptidase